MIDFKFNAMYLVDMDERELEESGNPFAKIFLVAKLALSKKISIVELLNKKIEIAGIY